MEDAKKKTLIISVCSLLLVAMVVALVVVSRDGPNEDIKDVSGSQKAITAICQTTDYQDTCLKSLDGQNSTNPKELIEVAFQSAIDYLREAIKNSTTLQEVQKDPRGKEALDTCGELANHAIDDLHRSYSKFANFDITRVDDVLMDLKIWLSGAMTQQETCLDGFEEVEGDAGDKMKKILTTSMQMTSNALAMVAEISTFLESMGMQSIQSRRLLFDDIITVVGHGDEIPQWVDFDRRELIGAQPQKIKPAAVVAKDGSGDYRTINAALAALPKGSNKTVVLYIKEGVYNEQVTINSTLKHLMMIGDGPTKTIITGNLNFIDGTGTYHTATVAVQGDDFIARDIGFENTAGAEKHQAVALRVSGDKAVFYNCHMDGYQDTLYAHTYRQFYRDCVISGTIDFIFGDSAAVFQGCTLLVRKPLSNQQNIVTAQGRKDLRQPTGLVIQNCTFAAHPEFHPVRHEFKSYLGRPWKEYSRTIIMESFLDDLIHADGWLPWNGDFALKTLFYTEFNNRGPASPKAQRVKWGGVKELPSNRIQRFTASAFLDGNRWIPATRVPYAAGFIFPVPKEDPNIKYSPVVPEENKDLGLTTNLNKEAFDAFKPNTTSTTAPTPTPAPPVPESNMATAPTGFSPGVSPASPGPASVPTLSVPETGEVIIDLSPSPPPITDGGIAASHSLSPTGSTPQAELAASPTGSTGEDLTASPSLSPTGSTPQPELTASHSLSPTGSTPQPELAASPTGSTGEDLTASPSLSPTGSTPQPELAASPTPQPDLAASPTGSTAEDLTASPSLPQTGSPSEDLTASPSQPPSGSTPQSELDVTPSLSPTSGSAPPPQAATDSSPISPTGASDSSPISPTGTSDAAASPPTSTTAPQSSNPLAAEAPTNALTA